MPIIDVAIIGAGPYGLSAAAYLQRIRGLETRLFGEPMSFWEQHMPEGMLLRSHWEGSHITDPQGRWSLDAYRRLGAREGLSDPLPAKDFIAYGRWFQESAKLPLDRRKVMRIDGTSAGFQLSLVDGDTLHARRVVIAAGIQPFAHRPKTFDNLPDSVASHSSNVRQFDKFRGKEVLVVGGGQSALEAASFLRHAGANSEMLIRRQQPRASSRFKWLPKGNWNRILYGRGDVGPAGISLIVQRPNLFRRFPQHLQLEWDRRSHKTWFSWRHVPVKEIPIQWGRFVTEAKLKSERLSCTLNDGSVRTVDHIILATGYRVNVTLYDFLSPGILERIELANGYPTLDAGLESSVPGLHFLGAPAARSFGPLVRFVAGCDFLARSLARRVGARKRSAQRSSQTEPSWASPL